MTKPQSFVLALAWGILVLGLAFLSPLLGGSPTDIGPGVVLWGLAPVLVTLGFRAGFRRWDRGQLSLRLSGNRRLYVAVLIAVPSIMLSQVGLAALTGSASFESFQLTDYLVAAGIGILVFLVLAFLE